MSSVADAGSTVFSMRSHAVSRTTTDTTKPFVTPLEEGRRTGPSLSGMGGPREMDMSTGDPSAKKNVESSEVKYINARPFIIDKTLEPDRTSLRRRQTAKQLIHGFEALTRRAATAQYERPSSSRANSDTSFHEANHPFLTLAPSKSKRRSLSNSLRNFMAVFKKRRDRDQDDDARSPPRCRVEFDCDEVNSHPFPLEPSVREIALSTSTASALLSGPLLHLSRPSPSASSVLPVWASCTVTLHDSHLLITWYTLHGNPSSQVVPLGSCMDVHSLALKQLDADERALLPMSGNNIPKIFELLFEGRPPEKFAATSSHDRAQWVSAIWDTVLSSRDSLGPAGRDYGPRGTLTVTTAVPPLEYRPDRSQPHSASEHSASEYSSSSAVETPGIFAEGYSVPPTPIAKSPRHGNSPMTLFPPGLPSQPPTHPRPKSPSIAKLGTLSVVTQRLAEISQTESASSTPTTKCTSSTAVTALQRAQTTYSTRVTQAFTEIEHMPHGGGMSVGTPLDEDGRASIVIPLPDTPKTLLPDTASVRSRSAFSRSRRLPTAPAPWSMATTTALEPIPQSNTTLSEPTIRTNGEAPPNFPSAPSIEPQLLPFAELIKENAAKHYDQTAALGEQIIALQRDIHNLPQELQPVVTQAIAAMIQRDERQGTIYSANTATILARFDDIQKQASTTWRQVAVDGIVNTLESIHVQLASQIPEVMGKLASIEQGLQAVREVPRETPTSSRRSGPTVDSEHATSPVGKGPRSGTPLAVDLSDIHAKLDDLASLYRTNDAIEQKSLDVPLQEQNSSTISEKLQAILDHLKTGGEQRESQLAQQADSVRYLNELNSWLDTFVNNGTAQIQAIAAGVEQLCEQFGAAESVEVKDHEGDGTGIIPNIKQLLSSVQKKTRDEEQLQISVAHLISAVHEHLKVGADQQNTIVTDSVLAIIDRQRRDQEQMLRALSSELTNEIRGERLRFVEAMKEATAINVQGHVEHFKAELGREVAVMTEDVGRLHQEKQALEQQIADLFAFYSKQKQEADSSARRAPTTSTGLHNLQNLPAAAKNEGRRPLPNPIYRKK